MTLHARQRPEWIGATLDTAVPLRVQERVLGRHDEHCAECTRPIRPGDQWTCDHIIAIINGGENRESNLQPLCTWCRPIKDTIDVALKAKNYRIRCAHFGKRKSSYPPMPGTKRSRYRKRMNGTVELRRLEP